MKKFYLAVLFIALTAFGFAQKTNIKAGLWSEKTTWSGNTVPVASDDIVLNFDVIVDIDAVCQSLTLNGHNVTVNSNVHLNISGVAKTVRLSKFIQLDTTRPAPFDTTGILSLTYDNAGRNIGMEQIYYQEDHTLSFQSSSIFYYNGNDTLPFKRVVDIPANKYDEHISDTSFYFYTNGLLTKDSSIEISSYEPFWEVNSYQYLNNTIVYTNKEYNTNPDTVYISIDTVHLKYENGNIVSQVDTTDHYERIYSFRYDDHPNPFYRTQAKIAIDNRFPLYSMETYIEEVFARNNALEIDQTSGGNRYHMKYVYEYNANGYPRQVRMYDQVYPEFSSKGIYIY